MLKNAWRGTPVPVIFRTLLLITFATFGLTVSSHGQGDIPVDLATGAPRVTVPLGGVSDHDLGDAFALNYSVQGVSVKTAVGFYGIGWNMAGGGRVARSVRGLPDDLNETSGLARKGWLNSQSNVNTAAFGNMADGTASTCSDELADFNQLQSFGYNKDTEPDLFYYSVGGVSGSFVFDNTNTPQIRLIPYKDVKIEPQFTNSKITAFFITTNDGVLYELSVVGTTTQQAVPGIGSETIEFGKTEYEQYKVAATYNDTWCLKKVTSPSGATLDYTYETVTYDGMYTGYDPDNMIQIWTNGHSLTYPYSFSAKIMYQWYNTMNVPRLTKVSGSNGARIEFAYSKLSAETDDKGLLTSVSLYDTYAGTTAFKIFSLGYALYGCTERCTDTSGDGVPFDYTEFKRAFLSSLAAKGGTIDLPPYKFSYKSPDLLPMPNSWAVDFWGYANGASMNTNRAPTVYIYPQLDPSERYRVYPISGYTGEQYILKGSDLTVNPDFVQAGALTMIEYPAGGKTILEYEPNEFYDAVAGQSYPAAGVRVKSITTEDGLNAAATQVRRISYVDADGKSSGRILYKPSFAIPRPRYISGGTPSSTVTKETLEQQGLNPWIYLTARTNINMAPDDGVALYGRVKTSVVGSGYTVAEFATSGSWGSGATDLWSPSVIKFARQSTCASMGLFPTASVGIYPYFINSNDPGRGLPLSTRSYNEQGVLVHEQSNTYQYIYRPGTTAAMTVWGVQYQQLPNAPEGYHYTKYSFLTDVARVPASHTETVYDALSTGKKITTTQEVFYESQYHRLPTRTRQVESDGTVYTTYAKYPLDYGAVPTGADKRAEMIGKLQAAFRNGIVIEQYRTAQPSGGSVSVQGASLSTFDDFGGTRPLAKQRLVLASIPLSSFVFSSINPTSKALEYNASYEVASTVKSYYNFDVPSSVEGANRVTSSTVWGYNSTRAIAKVVHAGLEEFAFSDFETPTARAFDLQGGSIPSGSGAATYAAGHTGVNAVYPTTQLRKIITRGADRYIFSGWVNPQQTTVTLTLKIMNSTATTTSYTKNITFETPAGNAYRYFEYVIPVPSGLTSFMVEVTGTYSALVNGKTPGLDDVAFYPEHADLVSFTYTMPFGVREQTVRDKTIKTEYDKLGRVVRTRDIDNNIVQQISYTDASRPEPVVELPALEPGITSSPGLNQIFVNVPITFTANNLGIPNAVYRWKVNSVQVGTGTTLTYTFTNVDSVYSLCLEVEAPGYLSGSQCVVVKVKQGGID